MGKGWAGLRASSSFLALRWMLISFSSSCEYSPSISVLNFCNQTGGGTAFKTQMESKKLIADESSFQSFWEVGTVYHHFAMARNPFCEMLLFVCFFLYQNIAESLGVL